LLHSPYFHIAGSATSIHNILLISGAGYIGSYMVLELQREGHSVVVFDNLSRGFADALHSAPLFVGDLRSSSDLDACFIAHPIDIVMHFAAMAYVGESVTEPELYYQNNVIGALNLLSAMKRHGVNRFVFSSTCATYGEPKYVPIDENHQQLPINPYGRTKLMIEDAIRDYSVAYGIQCIGLRYFNAAGSDPLGRVGERHDPETHLIPLILLEAKRLKHGGNPVDTTLRVFGNDFPTHDGSCIRDYIHVQDLCRAHSMAARRLFSGNTHGAEFYNLANGKGFSVFEVIEACRRVTGQPIQYVSESRRAGDPAVLIGDARLADKILGWKPAHTELDSMISTAWVWMNT